MDTEWKPTGKARFAMATTWRSSGIGIVFCMQASTCAWGSPGDWTRIAKERSIAENSPEQSEVLERRHARAAPRPETGRATGRERGCRYGEIWVVAGASQR